MNVESRYIRNELSATQKGICDPDALVEQWFDRLEDLLLDTTAFDPDEAYDLLALWAKFKRTRPELLEKQQEPELLEQLDRIVEQHGRNLAQQALQVPNPQGWLEEVERLDSLFEGESDPLQICELSVELIEQLDDAQLVLYAAHKQGVVSEELSQQIVDCENLLLDNPSLFLAASVYIQSLGMTVRPDLPETDYDLAATATKIEVLLDELEELEAWLELRHIPTLSDQQAKHLVEVLQKAREGLVVSSSSTAPSEPVASPAVVRAGFARQLLLPPVLAASGGQEPGRMLRWNSPDKKFMAFCAVPAQGTDKVEVAIFREADGQPASELAGQPVWLAGVEATIDETARCRFSLEAIRQSESDLVLEVGADKSVWAPVFFQESG